MLVGALVLGVVLVLMEYYCIITAFTYDVYPIEAGVFGGLFFLWCVFIIIAAIMYVIEKCEEWAKRIVH
ncbi:MAG: hypothetical protein AAB766_00210, partial [Patescibacteria group bacterium]